MKDRARVILVKNNKVALIKRVKEGQVYYVVPGGGVEGGETLEECIIREAQEELGLWIKVNECLFEIEDNGTHQYFFSGTIIGGEFGTGKGEEYTQQNKNKGTYEPVWFDVDRLPELKLWPKEQIMSYLIEK